MKLSRLSSIRNFITSKGISDGSPHYKLLPFRTLMWLLKVIHRRQTTGRYLLSRPNTKLRRLNESQFRLHDGARSALGIGAGHGISADVVKMNSVRIISARKATRRERKYCEGKN